MSSIANGELGSTVRAKINSLVSAAIANGDSDTSIYAKINAIITHPNATWGDVRTKLNTLLAALSANTGSVSVSTNADYYASTNTYRFYALRTGDTSGPWTGTIEVDASTLAGVAGVNAADFGGTLPSASLAFAAGETSKSFDVTPATNAIPE